jgi:hypothetical protein
LLVSDLVLVNHSNFINRTPPTGYLEVGKSAAEGGYRKTLEEACADTEILSPFAQLDIPLNVRCNIK